MKSRDYIKGINKYSEKLSDENKERVEDMVIKLRYSHIKEKDAEEFSYHCVDTILEAEERGLNIKDTLGTDDLEGLSDEFIKETRSGYSTWEKIYCYINYLPMTILIFTGIFEMLVGTVIKNFGSTASFSFDIPFTLSMLVDTLIAVACVIFCVSHMPQFYTSLSTVKSASKSVNKYIIMMWFTFATTIAIFVVSKLFLTQVLFHINFFIFIIIIGAICIVVHVVDNK